MKSTISIALIFLATTTCAQQKKALPNKSRNIAKPIVVVGTDLYDNEIGTPVARIAFTNTSSKDIDAVDFIILCYNNYNEPVTYPTMNNEYGVTYQDVIRPGDTTSASFTLHLHETTTKIKVKLDRYHFQQ